LPGIIFLWAGGCQLSRTSQGSGQRRRGFPTASRSTDSTGSPLVLPILWPLGPLDQSISPEPTTKKVSSMISPEIRVRVCHLYYAEHWKIGTIATDLGLHPDTVSRALNANHPTGSQPLRPSVVDPYIAFLRETLEQHPQLRATGAHFVSYAWLAGLPIHLPQGDLIGKRLNIGGFWMYYEEFLPKIRAALTETTQVVASGRLSLPITATYKPFQIKEAIEHYQRGGKVLLDFTCAN
jgi:hypothetical protein